MARPGVTVTEAPLPRAVSNPSTSESFGGFVGTAVRGPIQPTLVTSWSDFVAQFGEFSSTYTLPMALWQYFANYGGDAYVARVLPADAGFATATTDDTRLTFQSRTKGQWGNNISVDIADNETGDLVTVTVKEDIRGQTVVRERFRDLSPDPTSPRYVADIVNSTTIGSALVTVSDNDPEAAIAAESNVQLGGGNDGVAAISGADYAAAVELFDEIDANFVFNLPGLADVSAALAKIESPDGRGDSILVVDTDENQTPDMNGASLPSSSYAAVYYPWIWIADPAPDAPRGGIRKVPPGASAVGMILRTDSSRGSFKAPAGVTATLTGAIANERRLTNTQLDTLAGQNVNVVRPVPGSGIAAMGARTRAPIGSTAQYISVRRTINYVKKRAVEVSRFALFEPNSPGLWDQLRVANGAFLSELWSLGGLAGLEFAEAFYVKCDGENNTASTIGNGEVHVEIGIAPVFPAEFIVIKVGQFEADASVNVTEEV